MTLNPAQKSINMANVVQLVTITYADGSGDSFTNAEVNYVAGGVLIGYRSREEYPNQWMTVYLPNNIIAQVLTSV